jgi:hypothetical protein
MTMTGNEHSSPAGANGRWNAGSVKPSLEKGMAMQHDGLLNVLQGIVLFRCVTTSIVAQTWYAQSSSVVSMYEMARRIIRELKKQRLAILRGRQGREQVLIASSAGKRLISVETETIGGASVGSHPSMLFDAHTISVAASLGRLAQQISSIACMRFICACETPIVSGSRQWAERSDAVLGVVSTPSDDVVRDGVFTPVAWTTWADVRAVIERNLSGNMDEIAGYYALEIDRGTASISSFRERARLYRQGREAPPKNASMPVAPLPLVITTTEQRAKTIVRVWSESDPDTMVFAIDRNSLFSHDIFSNAWTAYRGRGGGAHAFARISPFGALRSRKMGYREHGCS